MTNGKSECNSSSSLILVQHRSITHVHRVSDWTTQVKLKSTYVCTNINDTHASCRLYCIYVHMVPLTAYLCHTHAKFFSSYECVSSACGVNLLPHINQKLGEVDIKVNILQNSIMHAYKNFASVISSFHTWISCPHSIYEISHKVRITSIKSDTANL